MVAKKKVTKKSPAQRQEPSVLTKMTDNEREAAFGILFNSAIAVRESIAARLGKSFNDDRKLYAALGYPTSPSYNDYAAKYERQDIARAVVDLPVRESWRMVPDIVDDKEGESEFEKQWATLIKDRKVFHYLSRVDRLASLGTYAILFLGFDDTQEQAQELTSARELLYMMPYTELNATVSTYESNTKNERYGHPTLYQVNRKSLGIGSDTGLQTNVHWTRILHVAEDTLEDDLAGIPRLRAILNRLYDLQKIVGGSAEMYWRGALPGYGLKVDENRTLGTQDLADLKVEMEKYLHGLQRFVRLEGVSIQDFAVQVADPSNHVDVQIDMICAQTRIPKRILLGSERGELASTQDKVAWAAVIEARRLEYCEPMILRPFIDRLIKVGALPEPKGNEYTIEWPDLLAPGDKEKAEIGEVRSKALKNYADSIGAEDVLPPEIFYKKILHLSDDEIEKIESILQKMQSEEPPIEAVEPEE